MGKVLVRPLWYIGVLICFHLHVGCVRCPPASALSPEAWRLLRSIDYKAFRDDPLRFGSDKELFAGYQVYTYGDSDIRWVSVLVGPMIADGVGRRVIKPSIVIPIKCDADVVDFYRRVTGVRADIPVEEQSEGYKAEILRLARR